MDENLDDDLNESLAEGTYEAEGIAIEEREQESFEPITPDGNQRWQGQLRRAGSAQELPGPQRYRDFPTWLTEPHKHPAPEEEEALA